MYILLFANQFLSAGGTIAMRKMKKFNDSVVSWYQLWCTLVISAIAMLAQNNGLFTVYRDFDWLSWLWMVLAAITSVYTETMRFKALKLHSASAL